MPSKKLSYKTSAPHAEVLEKKFFIAEFFGTKHLGSIKAAAAAAMVLGSAIGPTITGMLLDFNLPLEVQYIAIAVFFGFSSIMMWLGISHALRSQKT